MSTNAASIVQVLSSPTPIPVGHDLRASRLTLLLTQRCLVKPPETFFCGGLSYCGQVIFFLGESPQSIPQHVILRRIAAGGHASRNRLLNLFLPALQESSVRLYPAAPPSTPAQVRPTRCCNSWVERSFSLECGPSETRPAGRRRSNGNRTVRRIPIAAAVTLPPAAGGRRIETGWPTTGGIPAALRHHPVHQKARCA